MFEGVKSKFSILPILSGLLLAILAIGISGELFSVNTAVKHIATALLLLAVLSLQFYYSEAISLSSSATEAFFKHLGKENPESTVSFTKSIHYLITGKINGKPSGKDFFDRLSSQFPTYAILVLWWIVLLIICQIWL
jgi:hypothetical protein